MKMKIRAIPRLFRYAFLNSVISFFVTILAAHTFILPSDLGSEGNSLANVIILTFAVFVSLGNLTYLLIPIKRLPIINLLFAFTWFSILSFIWIYFSPDGAGLNDQSIKHVFFFYMTINTLLGIGTAFWYHKVIIKILGPDPDHAIVSFHFMEKIFPKKNKYSLQPLIEGARLAGLEEQDVKIANDFLKQNKVDLCFDFILKRLNERKIFISKEYYNTIMKAGNELKIPAEPYSYVKELIRND
jgi:hypothetical protein